MSVSSLFHKNGLNLAKILPQDDTHFNLLEDLININNFNWNRVVLKKVF